MDNLFDLVEQTLRCEGSGSGFDLLIRRLLQEKSYPLVFEARLMQMRHALGLPLILAWPLGDLPPESRRAYEAAMIQAARETGYSCLDNGDIVRAWPYFRAIGEPGPVAAAIENMHMSDMSEEIDGVLEIALGEGVTPRKGFELLLEHRGICDGLGFLAQVQDRDLRVACLQLLVRSFYRQLVTHLKVAIASHEGHTPETSRVAELIANRNWLFEGGAFYIENSHLVSILQASRELDDPETMRLVLEMAIYGQQLASIHRFPGPPPFEDPYVDHAEYLGALLGQNIDHAILHFRRKIAMSVPGSAEVVVSLLARLRRLDDAIQLSLEELDGQGGNDCPSAIQLCQMAADYQRLQDVARKNGDLLGFAAGIIQSGEYLSETAVGERTA